MVSSGERFVFASGFAFLSPIASGGSAPSRKCYGWYHRNTSGEAGLTAARHQQGIGLHKWPEATYLYSLTRQIKPEALANATITSTVTVMLLMTAQKIALFSIAVRRIRRGRSALSRYLVVSASDIPFNTIVCR
jgi:hypothetical protein